MSAVFDESGEMDLAKALAAEMGRDIQFQQRAFINLLSDLERGDIDLHWSPIFTLPRRRLAIPAIVSAGLPSGAIAGRIPCSQSPTWRSLPFIGGPAFAICALSTIRTVSGASRMPSCASATAS